MTTQRRLHLYSSKIAFPAAVKDSRVAITMWTAKGLRSTVIVVPSAMQRHVSR
jgi:hypothetical protein